MKYIFWLLLDYKSWPWLFGKPAYDTPKWKAVLCRFRNHPAGVFWYNPGGYEPDMRCRNCGDDLG